MDNKLMVARGGGCKAGQNGRRDLKGTNFSYKIKYNSWGCNVQNDNYRYLY